MNIEHVTKKLSGGGEVIVLNTGAQITPEAEAMLQALHSRSIGGLKKHLEVLGKKGPEGFMKTFYVGYGHKSIADCGSATVFVEGVSMLAAKAIQDWRLYSGQESSTRYIDFSQQPFIDPIGSDVSKDVLESWRSLYLDIQEPLEESLRKRFPRQEDEDETVYNKAIAARRFDISRAFLPAGASTNLAWHSNLRQFSDALHQLRHHSLEEVREIGEKIEEALQETFPGSFDSQMRFPKTEEYHEQWMKHDYWHRGDVDSQKGDNIFCAYDGVDRELLKEYGEYLKTRPEKTELPQTIGECGVLRYEFLLDFGSFRDVQRHRAVIQRMPLLAESHGFAKWYLEELPQDMREHAERVLAEQLQKIRRLDVSQEVKQYFLPMGYRLPCRLTGDLRALVYLAELRSTRFVHPTLRTIAIDLANDLKSRFDDFDLVLHVDDDPHRFDVRRGLQDIVIKE